MYSNIFEILPDKWIKHTNIILSREVFECYKISSLLQVFSLISEELFLAVFSPGSLWSTSRWFTVLLTMYTCSLLAENTGDGSSTIIHLLQLGESFPPTSEG